MTRADSEEPTSFADKSVDSDVDAATEPAGADQGPPQAEPAADGAQEQSVQAAKSPADELAERTADLQRLTAEYTNYRRRTERDRKSAIEAAKAGVVTELLGVLDDLDRARAHGDLESGPLKSVADKLTDALHKQGLVEFGTEGEAFDPTLHEAVQHEGSGHDPVLSVVMRKGFRFGDRVLRHALVGVADGVGDLPEADPSSDSPVGQTSESDAGPAQG